MSWTRESLFALALALCAPWAVADSITVNTTTDDNQANGLCSLREAVEYFNRGKPAGGYQGCVAPASDSSDVVSLPKQSTPYLITGSAIPVKVGLQIAGSGRTGDTTTAIRVVGAHRAFVIAVNPQFKPPRCSPNCATQPSRFDLSPTTDTGTLGDYLTSKAQLKVVGTLDGVPGASSSSPHNFIIRVYDNPAQGTPVQVGETQLPVSTSPMSWQMLLSNNLSYGVHHFTYKVEEVDAISGAVVTASTLYPGELQVAYHPAATTVNVQLDKMIIEGGCATTTDCGTNVDDDTTITNDPVSSNNSYNAYALSYSNGLTNTTGRGGIIYNDEALVLSDVLLTSGGAVTGGAVYSTSRGGLSIDNSELNSNHADRGAAVYLEYNTAHIERVLFTLNGVTTPSGVGAVMEVADPTVADPFLATTVTNVTFSGNDGRALSLRAGAQVNASTIVLNKGGIDFNGADVQVFNSILAGNTTNPDCDNLPVSPVLQNNLLVATGTCPTTGNQTISNVDGTPGQLMATLVDGRCASTYGLLCPLADHGGATFVHMPRLLPDYDLDPLGVGASPIINKGSATLGSLSSGGCPGQDQREKPRTYCDIGAVELQAVTSIYTRSGGTTSYGKPYTQFLGKELEDEEVLPASKCPAAISLQVPAAPPYYPPPQLAPDPTQVVPDSYQPTVPGCPWLEVAPSRGKVVFSADGNYTYTPAYQFHGTDHFYYRVVTTLSNLNVLPNDRSRLVRALVIVEPGSSMASDKLGGALGIFPLLLLAAVGLFTRRGGRA